MLPVADVTIRIYFEDAHGAIEDAQLDYDLSDFGGVIPSAGDVIFSPWVDPAGVRGQIEARAMWMVQRRVFNPRDMGGDYVVLVVRERPLTEGEAGLMP